MKIVIKTTIAFVLFVTQSVTAQNIYIVTEKYDNSIGLGLQPGDNIFDSLFVTTPAGVTTEYSLPHYLTHTKNHDSQLSVIINAITNLGYKNVSNNDWSGMMIYNSNNTLFNKPQGVIKTLIFAQP